MTELNANLIGISKPYEPLDVDRMAANRAALETNAINNQYRAAEFKQKQAALDADAAHTATLGRVGVAYASGDTQGAINEAAGAGAFDVVEQLNKMTEAQRKSAFEVSQRTAPVLLSLKKYPAQLRPQVLASLAPQLIQDGLPAEKLQALDLSDNGLDTLGAHAMTIEQYNSQQNSDRTFAAGRSDHADTLKNEAANRGVTIRGQNMADARSRQVNAILGKPPAGYNWTPDGGLAAIKGGPADTTANGGKPLTEAQSKATGYYGRTAMANNVLNKFEREGVPPPGAGAKFADEVPLGLASGLIGDKNQQQLAARRAFIAGVLRQESGAAISTGEFKSYDKLYFPQQGDTKATLKEKRALRDQAVKGLSIAAGPGASQMDMAMPQGGAVPADIAAILAKHGAK